MDIICEEVKEFTIERLKRSQDYEMSYFHHHSCYELFIILSGERKMILQDKIYQGCAGNIFLIPPQYIHRTSGAENIRVLIQFTEEYLGRFFSQHMINKMLKCFDIFTVNVSNSEFEKVINFINQIEALNKDGNEEIMVIKLAELLFLLCENMDYNSETNLTSTSMQLVSNILSYINNNYKKLSYVKKIADKFFVSEEYLCRIFKKHTGATVISYLNGLKLKAAEKLLLEEHKRSISEISEECGFSTSEYFGKIFKKNYGVSPLAYRNKNSEIQEGSVE